MLRGFRWFALPAVVVAAALVAPTAALADDCNGAAQSIYSEGCPPTAKGPSHPKPHKAQPASKPRWTPKPPPVVTPPVVVTPPPVVHPSTHVHKHGRKHLHHHVKRPKRVDTHVLASAPVKESSLGSAFDLGAGPMILFALLAGTVLLLLGTGGVRSWRNRHRV